MSIVFWVLSCGAILGGIGSLTFTIAEYLKKKRNKEISKLHDGFWGLTLQQDLTIGLSVLVIGIVSILKLLHVIRY